MKSSMSVFLLSSVRQALLAGLAALSTAPAQAQKVVPAQSEISFATKQMGAAVDGKFKKWDAQVTLDAKQLDSGKVNITIDTGSATLGSVETDSEMPKAVWFNVPVFPQASFQSSAIRKTGADKLEVAGKLRIKGITREIVVPVTLAHAGATTTASGAFVIKRLDFKIGEGEWSETGLVANDVQVRFKLALTGLSPL